MRSDGRWRWLLAVLWLLAGHAQAARADPAPVHITQAETWHSPSQSWAPPADLRAADDGVLAPATTWHTVALPHARARQVAAADAGAGALPEVWWYRMPLPASALAPTPQGPRLYIPRWQTLGTVAVYVNDHLVWQTRGSRVWTSFNQPVWLDLGGDLPSADTPVTVYVRMANLPGAGGVLTTLWAGPAESLRQGWRLRSLLQTDLLAYVRGANLVLGTLALLVWLSRRGRDETDYLLFFLMSVAHAFAIPHFLVDDEGFDLHDDWFSWATVAGSLGASVCAFFLLSRVQGLRYPRLARALLAYAAVVALALLPVWGLPHRAVLPVLRLAQIFAALPLLYIAVAGAWRLRAWPYALLAVLMLSMFPLWLHDLGMQRYRVDMEHIYVTPYLYVGVITMFLVVALVRHRQTQAAAERAQTVLAERLASQQAELSLAHERLRAVERDQTLMNERQRLMREMHDGVGSSLMSALRLVEDAPARSVNVAQVLRECIDDLKISIDSLEPVDADLLALLAGLRFRLEPRLTGAGIALHWCTSDDLPPLGWLDAQSALHVLRILQEVLTNIVKHSGAKAIGVTTAVAPSPGDGAPSIQVCVRDNGQPFTPPAAAALAPGRRGLANVRSRVQALGAHCGWERSGTGTVFSLWLPIQRPQG